MIYRFYLVSVTMRSTIILDRQTDRQTKRQRIVACERGMWEVMLIIGVQKKE